MKNAHKMAFRKFETDHLGNGNLNVWMAFGGVCFEHGPHKTGVY
jgi:hypothetical protein